MNHHKAHNLYIRPVNISLNLYTKKYAHKRLTKVCLAMLSILGWSMGFIYEWPRFSVALLSLGQTYDCPRASEVTLNDMYQIGW